MNVKTLGLTLAAGTTAFLFVGVAVTEFAQPWAEFSLLLGIPTGVAAGAVAAAGVYLGLADEAPARRRRVAGALGGFGTVFLFALVALAGLFRVGLTLALGVAFAVGLAAGVGAYLRGPAGTEPGSAADPR
jgi:hypothetical protein